MNKLNSIFLIILISINSSYSIVKTGHYKNIIPENFSRNDMKNLCFDMTKKDALNQVGVYIEYVEAFNKTELNGKTSESITQNFKTIILGVPKLIPNSKKVQYTSNDSTNIQYMECTASFDIDEDEYIKGLNEIRKERSKLNEIALAKVVDSIKAPIIAKADSLQAFSDSMKLVLLKISDSMRIAIEKLNELKYVEKNKLIKETEYYKNKYNNPEIIESKVDLKLLDKEYIDNWIKYSKYYKVEHKVIKQDEKLNNTQHYWDSRREYYFSRGYEKGMYIHEEHTDVSKSI